jgi:uncharacterized delta-60 repeat protein
MWPFSSHQTPRPQLARRVRSRKPRLEALEDRTLLSAGALDPTFGNGAGYVTTSPTSGADLARDGLIQPDGKILAAGIVYTPKGEDFGIVRYNPNGSLDTSFGSGGTALADFSSYYGKKSSLSVLAAVDDSAALYPQAGTVNDGKIVLAGHGVIGSKDGSSIQHVLTLARFNTNGTLDATLGNQGELITTFSVGTTARARVVVQPDGKMVVAVGSNNGFELARYIPNGTLDTTFGSGGQVVTSFGQTSYTTALLLQPDGKLIVSGDMDPSSGGHFWEVARYNPNGSLDSTFGTGGIVSGTFGPGADGEGAALYPGGPANAGKIIVVGVVSGGWGMARYNPDGSLDSTFGIGGEVITTTGTPYAVAIAADGKLVVAGAYNNAQAVFRYNADGSVDSAFGTGGIVTTAIGTSNSYASAGVLQSNGDIVTVGYATNSTKSLFGVARYLPSAPAIGAFTASPNPFPSGSSVTLTATGVADGNPGGTVTQVAFYVDSNGDGVPDAGDAVLGYGSQAGPGVWTFTFTLSLPPGTYTLFAQATDSYGVLGQPFALPLQVI